MRKNLYTVLMIVTCVLFLSILIFSKDKSKALSVIHERKGNVSLNAEWLNTKQAMEDLQTALKINPEDNGARLRLAQVYIEEARISGDHAYYDPASLALLDRILETEPENFNALCCKATVLLSQHHFSEGLAVAQQALPLNPDNSFIYGLLCDAHVELGNYEEAVKMADKMVSVRPDIRSYARISYLREIHGDYPGAIQAAKLAVAAGYPGLEQTAFTRMILAHLYEKTGKYDSAEWQCRLALNERPDYPYALAGLGRLDKAKRNYQEAIARFEKAKQLITEYSFADELTDLYKLNNNGPAAEKSANEVIQMLGGEKEEEESSSAHGHYADKELAHAYLKLNDTDNALKHALKEFLRRPANIDACETLAWVYYKRKEMATAEKLIILALRTHSKNPELRCRAGLIKLASGEKEKGKALIRQAFDLAPLMADIELKNESAYALSSL